MPTWSVSSDGPRTPRRPGRSCISTRRRALSAAEPGFIRYNALPRASPETGGAFRRGRGRVESASSDIETPGPRGGDMADYVAYFNGEYLPFSQVKIDPLDRGFLVGDCVFD